MGNPIRVLHVVVNMNRGGAETLIMNLYRNIDRSKVQFDFLTCKPGVFDSEIQAMGGKVHRISYLTEVGHANYIKGLDHFFQLNNTYKIVHAHMDKMSGLVLRAAKKAKIPVRIAHSHGTKSEGNLASKIYKWYAGNFIKPSATHLYACSKVAARWLYGNKAKSHILKNGIDTDKFCFNFKTREQIRSNLQIKDDALVLGHIGRFSQPKNHLFLLDVFSDIHEILPDSKLVLVGDGPLKPKIIEKINSLNLSNSVKLLGVREDINIILQSFDLFIFPSLHEGLPLTLIEAQSSGIPCLLSDKITKEVDLGLGLVNYLPLTNRNNWKETIIKLFDSDKPRIICSKVLLNKGYDIKDTSITAQSSYLSLGEIL